MSNIRAAGDVSTGLGVAVLVLVSMAFASPELPLDAAERADLDRRVTVWGRSGDEAWGARVIDAPVDAVWTRILDYDRYVEFYPYVTRSSLDEQTSHDGDPVYVSSVNLTTRGLTTRYTLTSELHPDQGWMSFDVAPKSRGPVAGAHGWWRVEPWNGEADRTLVTYTLSVDPGWWMPDWLGSLAARRAIPLVLDALAHRVDQAELTANR